MATPVAENINFSEEEEAVIQLWKKLDAFKTCLKQSAGKPRYTFYDGPPFATGLPHYGHILTGTIKDIITRYAHQSGYHVERRFGWDCHGLPVEYEIDKALDIKGPADVMKIGIEGYNNECRKIVTRYCKEWEEIVWRVGRWIDFKNDYKTMYPSFMESVWWVFRELFVKGMVYKGVKVMPFSTACNTPLSNFESGQNYKEVNDPAVIVSFPLLEEPAVSLIAWTTTPWTLPSNLALCVNADKQYVKVQDNSTNKVYVMMEARIEALFRKPEEYTVLETFPGKVLFGKSYEPIFSYFSSCKKNGAFRILCDGYVTEESGTGVVHQAPYFGEDDYRVCLTNKIIKKDDDIICPVDESGCFTAEVVDFAGQYVKDADKEIVKMLKNHGRLVHQSTVKHSYPFCWRSETPLIYKAVPSWFVRVEQIAHKLLESNSSTYWVPDYVKEKRFANWLRDARDWAISRNRYWGTPIPLWVSDDGEEVVCVGSIEELEKLTGTKIKDLHRENIDKLTIPSALGKGVLRRVSEVFDCWFESGSMPYAQVHYPFENKTQFEDAFPADFIAEGIDQTRGWFYTLLVLSTALFGKPPFKNLICNGLVLASDGQKMSKSKKNYPDPMEVVNKYGADALRLYLINSPAVRGDNLRFKEEGVRDILKDVFLPWYNAYRFFVQNLNRFVTEEDTEFIYDRDQVSNSSNIMDRWITSCTQSLLLFVKQEMSQYHLYTVVPVLLKFIDNLTNWYVRFNRKRLKGEGGRDDCLLALETLFGVLFTLIKIMAPFTPFLTELMFQNLKQLVSETSEDTSVHYLMIPDPDESFVDEKIERAVSKMQSVIELGRIIRDKKTLPVKYPLFELVVVNQDKDCLNDILSLEKYILEELNIKKLTVSSDKSKYGVQMRAEPEHKTLGARLRTDFKPVMQAIKQLSDEKLQVYLNEGKIMVLGHELGSEDLRIMFTVQEKSKQSEKYEAHADGNLLVMLDVLPDQSLMDEGLAREVINRIQKLRKKAHLVPSDMVTVYYDVSPAKDNLLEVVTKYQEFIENIIKAPLQKLPHPDSETVIIKEQQQLKGSVLNLVVTGNKTMETDTNLSEQSVAASAVPFTKFVDVRLINKESGPSASDLVGTILLENPQEHFLDFGRLVQEVKTVFGLQGRDIMLELGSKSSQPFLNTNGELNLKLLHQDTLLVLPKKMSGVTTNVVKSKPSPQCAFVNVEFKGKRGTVLLENPKGTYHLCHEALKVQVANLFNIKTKFKVLSSASECVEVSETCKLNSLHGKTLYVVV